MFKYQSKLGSDNPVFKEHCEKMKRKFLRLISAVRPTEVFELDNEYFRHDPDITSPRNYCRQEVHDILGFYPTPVFKMHQGYQYWKDLCEDDRYPTLAIGGLAQTRSWHTNTEEIHKMMNYARDCGKKVHLLGCQNVETFKLVKPDTVDYSIIQYAINVEIARAEHPELTVYEDLKIHVGLHAFSRAISRSVLYDKIIAGKLTSL